MLPEFFIDKDSVVAANETIRTINLYFVMFTNIYVAQTTEFRMML